ncbi:Carboxypeptidase B, partial [Caligus rogercresseyi]
INPKRIRRPIRAKAYKTSSRSIDFENYYGVDDIFAYLDELKADYDFVDVEVYGQSYEKRDLKVIKIQKAGSGAPNIFIEAGIHAREWIAPAMATYIIHSLLEIPANSHYLDQFNFHIMPSVNPDGYEFSRNGKRLWRKTRMHNEGAFCRGVDATEIGISIGM